MNLRASWTRLRRLRINPFILLLLLASALTGLVAVAVDWPKPWLVVPAITAGSAVAGHYFTRLDRSRTQRHEKEQAARREHAKAAAALTRLAAAAVRERHSERFRVRESIRPEIPYIRRDAHDEALENLRCDGCLLLIGDPATGKSRLAQEVVRELMPERTIVMVGAINRFLGREHWTAIEESPVPSPPLLFVVDEVSLVHTPGYRSWADMFDRLTVGLEPRPMFLAMLTTGPNADPHVLEVVATRLGRPIRVEARWSPKEIEAAKAFLSVSDLKQVAVQGLPRMLAGEAGTLTAYQDLVVEEPIVASACRILYWWESTGVERGMPVAALASLVSMLERRSPSEAARGVSCAVDGAQHGLSLLVDGPSHDNLLRPVAGGLQLSNPMKQILARQMGDDIPKIIWASAIQLCAHQPRDLTRIAGRATTLNQPDFAEMALSRGALEGDAECLSELADLKREQGDLARAVELRRLANLYGATATSGITPITDEMTGPPDGSFVRSADDLYQNLMHANATRSLTLLSLLEAHFASIGEGSRAEELRARAEEIVAARRDAISRHLNQDDFRIIRGIEWFLDGVFGEVSRETGTSGLDQESQ